MGRGARNVRMGRGARNVSMEWKMRFSAVQGCKIEKCFSSRKEIIRELLLSGFSFQDVIFFSKCAAELD